MDKIIERLEWTINGQLKRPSNYDRRVVVSADDVLALITHVKEEQ